MANTTMNVNTDPAVLNNGNDSIVVTKALLDVPSGVILDVSAFTQDYICAGHIIVRDSSTKNLKPLGISGSDYAEIGSDTYIGVLRYTVTKTKPLASVVTMGQVNAAASPYPITKAIMAGLPRIDFVNADPKK